MKLLENVSQIVAKVIPTWSKMQRMFAENICSEKASVTFSARKIKYVEISDVTKNFTL